jgi:oligopeptide/dipeptide ABC transporter ATP-binding protein
MSEVIRVENLKTYFKTLRGIVKAVDGVSLHIDEGEIVGLVGESGCGKSVTMLSVMQLINVPPGKIVAGKVIFEGKNILEYPPRGSEMSHIRGANIAMIFQEPMTSLNPVLTIARQLTETLEIHLKMNPLDARERAIRLLSNVEIPNAKGRIDDYPHQFSGGMRQRVMIAMALSCNPRMVIADEPTTALDVTTQAQLLELMKEQVTAHHTSLILVTHNLGVVARYVERIYVMYAGRVVEASPSSELFARPRHPYTIGLLNSVPRLGETRKKRKLVPITGMPPNLIDMPTTCAFLPRCHHHIPVCEKEPWPILREVGKDHIVSCYANVLEKT